MYEDAVKAIYKEQGKIQDVFFAGCGGSLVEGYPGYYFLNTESETIRPHWVTAKELVVSPSRFLRKGALVILTSHSGNTPEVAEAAKLSRERGAAIITLTSNPDSLCGQPECNPLIYTWTDSTNEKDKPQGIILRMLNELLKLQEPAYEKYDAILDGLEKIDAIIRRGVKSAENRTWLFAEKYSQEPFLYTVGSGASFSFAYAFSICSLQEMQWQDCCYIHSGEYFHGPFECTDENRLYILLKGTGRPRVMDERVHTFLKKYAKKYEVIDAQEYGLNEINEEVSEYFCPMFFYAMSVAYRTALGNKRCHPTKLRRYMGVVEY